MASPTNFHCFQKSSVILYRIYTRLEKASRKESSHCTKNVGREPKTGRHGPKRMIGLEHLFSLNGHVTSFVELELDENPLRITFASIQRGRSSASGV